MLEIWTAVTWTGMTAVVPGLFGVPKGMPDSRKVMDRGAIQRSCKLNFMTVNLSPKGINIAGFEVGNV
jgi:hypothetical protein